MTIQHVESWILRHAPQVVASAGYVGRVLGATGLGSLTLALLTFVVQGATRPESDAVSGFGIGLLLLDPYVGIFAAAVVVAWGASAALALPVLAGRRVYASGLFVFALECIAVLIGAWIGGRASLLVVVATYPVALAASRFVPSLSSLVRARSPA